MPYYLVPMVDTARFPGAPAGSEAAGLTRRVPYGYGLVAENHIILGDHALLWSDDRLSAPGVVEIGTERTEAAAVSARRDLERFANDGRTYTATDTFSDVVRNLLTQPSDRRLRRWGALRAGKPTKRTRYHHKAIWLGPGGRGNNLFHVEKVAPWHDTTTWQDNYNRADGPLDGSTLSSGGTTWKDTSASTPYAIVSNRLSVLFPMNTSQSLLTAADAGSDDLYAQIELVSRSDTNQFQGIGVTVCAADDAITDGYIFYVDDATDLYLEGINAGVLDTDTSYAGAFARTWRLERSGSSVEAFADGGSVLGPSTNTGENSGAGYRRVGVHGYRFVSGSSTFVADNFDGGDLAAVATGHPAIKRWGGVPFMRIGGTTFGQGWG
jgi:hypothetical protein